MKYHSVGLKIAMFNTCSRSNTWVAFLNVLYIWNKLPFYAAYLVFLKTSSADSLSSCFMSMCFLDSLQEWKVCVSSLGARNSSCAVNHFHNQGTNNKQKRRAKSKCSNDPYSPCLQNFFTVISFTYSTIMTIWVDFCNFTTEWLYKSKLSHKLVTLNTHQGN